MNPEWVAWAKEEIVAFHKIVQDLKMRIVLLNDKIAALEKELADEKKNNDEAHEDITRLMIERNEAEERGARSMLDIILEALEASGIGKQYMPREYTNADVVRNCMQLWRERRSK